VCGFLQKCVSNAGFSPFFRSVNMLVYGKRGVYVGYRGKLAGFPVFSTKEVLMKVYLFRLVFIELLTDKKWGCGKVLERSMV
jgi:hypothetical protein